MTTDLNDQTALGSAIKQADIVQYQQGSIVSRMLIKKPSGNITAFAFDQGESLSEHTAPFDALVLMVEGEADISIAKVEHRLKGGDMIIMPAGKPHAVKAATKFKMILAMIKE
jgi:quercetin dioxygenase-like cupin family protein